MNITIEEFNAKTAESEKIKEIMQLDEAYVVDGRLMPNELQPRAHRLCWQLNQADPTDEARQAEILEELLGTWNPGVHFLPNFHCDYGFNIHAKGFCFFNYNCVVLDTSPVYIGNGVFVGPASVLACAGHAVNSEQRKTEPVLTSAPIHIEDNVWIGANCTICGGVTIGEGSVIAAGSVVTKDIPAGVVAGGSPARVIKSATEADRLELMQL